MSRYCVDTSAYSQLRAGESNVSDLLDSAEWIGMPVVVLGELWAGFAGGSRARRNESELTEFLSYSVVHELFVDSDVARVYGEILSQLRAAGTPVPTNDVWIAATAARHGASVVTYDRHFGLMKRVGAVILAST